MMLTASRQTLVANLFQQICAAILLLVLPNLLTKDAYAEIVFATVLLSFAALSDLGLSLVYGRIVPMLHQEGAKQKLKLWDENTLAFGLLASCIYAAIIAAIYYLKYGNFYHSLMLLWIPVLTLFWAFHIGRVSARGDFSAYRRVISWRALGTLLTIPSVWAFQLTGWFVGMIGACGLLWLRFARWIPRCRPKLHHPLITSHLKEAITLGVMTVIWMQLINFARLYASVQYVPDTLAHYGIMSAGFQSASTLIISIFLPFNVALLRSFSHGDRHALCYAYNVIKQAAPWIILLTALAIPTAILCLKLVFPDYEFEPQTVGMLLLPLMLHPYFIMAGGIFVGRKQPLQYVSIITGCMLLAFGSAYLFDCYLVTDHSGAVWGQLIGLSCFTLLLHLGVWHYTSNFAAPLWRRLHFCCAGYVLAMIMGLVILLGYTHAT